MLRASLASVYLPGGCAKHILALPTLKGPTYAVMRTEYET
jgi:hypothetical protein